MEVPKSGTDYDALKQNNPYRNYKYTQSAFDKIGNWLNQHVFKSDFLKTKEMAVADEMANKANSYDAQIGEVQREEMYNSADEQAQRMREAGINPDLQASGINGGEASPFDNQAASEMPTAEQIQAINDDAGNLMSAVIAIPSTLVGVLSSGVDLASKAVSLEGQINNLFVGTNNAAKDFISQYITGSGDLSAFKEMSDEEILSYMMKDPSLKAQYPLVSMRKKVSRSIVRQIRSMDTETGVYNRQGELYGARNNPLNTDESIAAVIAEWTTKYNEARLKALTRQSDGDYLQAEFRALGLEATKALVEEFQSLYDKTNKRAYAYSVAIANQLANGEIDKALETFAASKAFEGAIVVKDAVQNDPEGVADAIEDAGQIAGEMVDDLTQSPGEVVRGAVSGAVPSAGAGTIDDDGHIVVTDYPEGVEPNSPRGRAHRRVVIFNESRRRFWQFFRPHRRLRRKGASKRHQSQSEGFGTKNLDKLWNSQKK